MGVTDFVARPSTSLPGTAAPAMSPPSAREGLPRRRGSSILIRVTHRVLNLRLANEALEVLQCDVQGYVGMSVGSVLHARLHVRVFVRRHARTFRISREMERVVQRRRRSFRQKRVCRRARNGSRLRHKRGGVYLPEVTVAPSTVAGKTVSPTFLASGPSSSAADQRT